jgi:hypothetical protein
MSGASERVMTTGSLQSETSGETNSSQSDAPASGGHETGTTSYVTQ